MKKRGNKSPWISVEDDLPCNHSDLVLTYNDMPFSTKRVIVLTDDLAYGNRKNGFEESIPQLRNTEDITGDTYNTIIYQEQCMLISKKVAKFDDSQSDSLCRKPLA